LNLLSTLDPCSLPTRTAHDPMPHPMIIVSANHKTTPKIIPATQLDYLHSIPHPDNLLPQTAVPLASSFTRMPATINPALKIPPL